MSVKTRHLVEEERALLSAAIARHGLRRAVSYRALMARLSAASNPRLDGGKRRACPVEKCHPSVD